MKNKFEEIAIRLRMFASIALERLLALDPRNLAKELERWNNQRKIRRIEKL